VEDMIWEVEGGRRKMIRWPKYTSATKSQISLLNSIGRKRSDLTADAGKFRSLEVSKFREMPVIDEGVES
jgi:hypothetical protein